MVFGRKDDDGAPKTVELRTVSGGRFQINGVPGKSIAKITTAIRWGNLNVAQFPVEDGLILFPIASVEMVLVHDAPVDAGDGVYTYDGDGDEDE